MDELMTMGEGGVEVRGGPPWSRAGVADCAGPGLVCRGGGSLLPHVSRRVERRQ